MAERTERLSLFTVILLLLMMLFGLIHAIADAQLARSTRLTRRLHHLFPAGWFEA